MSRCGRLARTRTLTCTLRATRALLCSSACVPAFPEGGVLGACLQLGDEEAMRELAINQFSGLFAEDSQASYGSDGMD